MSNDKNMSDADFIAMRGRRACATLLAFKEERCDAYLPEDVSNALRKKILDQINGVCDLAIEMLNEGIVYNEIFRERFEKMYDMVEEIYHD